MRIINIMQDVRAVNNGIREAATNASRVLLSKYDVQTELWFYGRAHQNSFHAATPVSLEERTVAYLKKKMEERKLTPQTDIIVTHGPWNFQSFWGNHLAKKNYKWIFVPHGTIQPCSMAQKWLKKKIYFSSVEKKMLTNATLIRAISFPEKNHLKKLFPGKEIVYIPNGIDVPKSIMINSEKGKRIFLFMARLHQQKGIAPLVKA